MTRSRADESSFLTQMLLIRRTEEKLLDLFSKGEISGTTHTSIGQEACSVGVISALDTDRDVVFSNHRCHGHFLAYGGALDALLGEVTGKKLGACAGIGGSQHLQYRNFYSNGILGGTVPAATGMALAEKLRQTGAIVAAFLGDGAFGEGIVYESFNISALWKLPMLFVVEANGYAQSTPTALQHSGDLADRPRAFGIETRELQVLSPVEVHAAAASMVQMVRETSNPACLVLHTYRLGPHSKGDDTRTPEELAEAGDADPLNRMLRELPPQIVGEAEVRTTTLLEESLVRCAEAETLTEKDFAHLSESRG